VSRWDREPTSFQRWLVRRRTGVRVSAVLVMVLAICGLVYDLVAVGLDMGLVGPIVGITSSLNILLISRDVSRLVERYDSARHQGPSSS
jgi:predicted membrane-bound spermidine synthase